MLAKRNASTWRRSDKFYIAATILPATLFGVAYPILQATYMGCNPSDHAQLCFGDLRIAIIGLVSIAIFISLQLVGLFIAASSRFGPWRRADTLHGIAMLTFLASSRYGGVALLTAAVGLQLLGFASTYQNRKR